MQLLRTLGPSFLCADSSRADALAEVYLGLPSRYTLFAPLFVPSATHTPFALQPIPLVISHSQRLPLLSIGPPPSLVDPFQDLELLLLLARVPRLGKRHLARYCSDRSPRSQNVSSMQTTPFTPV